MFLFPLGPGVEDERTGEQIIEGGKTTLPRPCTGRGQSFVLRFLGPPFPSSFRLASSACAAQVWVCLALSVLPRRFCCCQHANSAHRGSTAQLPAQLQICAPSHPGRRANAAPSSVDFAHRKQAITHSCSARRCVPRPASYGVWAPGRPIILLLPLCVLQFVGKSRLFARAVPSHTTQPTTN